MNGHEWSDVWDGSEKNHSVSCDAVCFAEDGGGPFVILANGSFDCEELALMLDFRGVASDGRQGFIIDISTPEAWERVGELSRQGFTIFWAA